MYSASITVKFAVGVDYVWRDEGIFKKFVMRKIGNIQENPQLQQVSKEIVWGIQTAKLLKTLLFMLDDDFFFFRHDIFGHLKS